MAGVCGVCGDMGFPGDEDVEREVAATMGGTLASCLLEELDDRCISCEDEIDSDKAALESRILWNLVRAALVLRVAASDGLLCGDVRKLLRSFF